MITELDLSAARESGSDLHRYGIFQGDAWLARPRRYSDFSIWSLP